ncbi:hypothetical protein RJI07_03975 [Mycoplasmatota bacterium WC30]
MKNQLPELISLLEKDDSDDVYYSRYKKRFIDREKKQYDIKNPLLVSILHEYEEYFISVFYDCVPRKKAKINLRLSLCKILKTHKLTMLFLEKQIKRIFEEEGFHFLGNPTSGYYGPYIWRKTEEVKYKIEIPNGKVELPVFFMHGFIMKSWLDYISFGEIGTGGWAEKEGLYCVFNSYKDVLEKPDFKISYLIHEAQHNIDSKNKKYSMSSALLEYRAKLAELVYYPNLELFESFLLHAKNDKKLSHPLAQFWLISDLSRLIFDQDYVNDIKQWESKLTDIQKHSSELLLNYNRCKTNWIMGILNYYIRALFV